MELKKNTELLVQKRLLFIKKKIFEYDWKEEEIGLVQGKLGAALFFFAMSRMKEDGSPEKDAERLLTEIFVQLNAKSKDKTAGHGFFQGLSGIAFGVNYLIQEGFIDADADEVLESADDLIYRAIGHSVEIPMGLGNGILGYLAYLLPRINDGDLAIDMEKAYVFKRLLITLVNRLGDAIEERKLGVNEPITFDITWNLPACLILFSSMIRIGLYRAKVVKMLNYLSVNVLSLYPRLQSNRLNLLVAIKYVLREIEIEGWKEHSEMLRKGIDLEFILYNELMDKSITLAKGTAGIYWLISQYNHNFNDDVEFHIKTDKLVNRVLQSSYWTDDLIINQHCLFHGLPGIGIMLVHLKNKAKTDFNLNLVQGSLV